MRAAHSPRRSRGPLLLAAAVCAGLLYAAARRPSGTELPAAPQSYIEGVALATSPWPKLQARQGAGCSAIRCAEGGEPQIAGSGLVEPVRAAAAVAAAVAAARSARPLRHRLACRTSATWRCCGSCRPRPWVCCLWRTAAATRAATSGPSRGAACTAWACQRRCGCAKRRCAAGTPWWRCRRTTGRHSAGTTPAPTSRRTSRWACGARLGGGLLVRQGGAAGVL